MVDYSSMTVDEAVAYCYRHRTEFIKDSEVYEPEEFNCLISLLRDGDISPSQLPEYGMDYGG